jgi:hypothetical protein
LSVHVPKDVGDRTTILACLRHLRSQCLANVRGVAPTFRERLNMALTPDAAFIVRGPSNRAATTCPASCELLRACGKKLAPRKTTPDSVVRVRAGAGRR